MPLSPLRPKNGPRIVRGSQAHSSVVGHGKRRPGRQERIGQKAINDITPTVWGSNARCSGNNGQDKADNEQPLLDQHFRGRPIVLFLDRDARDKALEIRKKLRSSGLGANDRPIVIAELPPGRGDVGDCTTEEAWHQIGQALEQAVTCPSGI
jgi:hypothetical protein